MTSSVRSRRNDPELPVSWSPILFYGPPSLYDFIYTVEYVEHHRAWDQERKKTPWFQDSGLWISGLQIDGSKDKIVS